MREKNIGVAQTLGTMDSGTGAIYSMNKNNQLSKVIVLGQDSAGSYYRPAYSVIPSLIMTKGDSYVAIAKNGKISATKK